MLSLFFFSLCSPQAAAADGLNPELSLKGYAEVRGNYSNVDSTPWATVERLRPTLTLRLMERVKLTATPEATLEQGRFMVGEYVELLRDPIEGSLGFGEGGPTMEEIIDECGWDLETTRTIDEVSDVLTLERLYLDLNFSKADIRVGRQAVNWGSALFFNPTDVISEVLLVEPWRERVGVDGARVTVPIGEDAQVTAVVGTDSFESYKGGLRGGLHRGTTDFAAVASTDGSEHFGGVDIRGDNVVGWWFEGGGVFMAEEDPAMKFSIGADYSFFILERLYVAAQLSHDGTGQVPALYDWSSRQPEELRLSPCENYNSLPIPEPSPHYRQTLGRWYGLNYLIWDLTEDWSLTNITIVNLADGTGMLFPTTTRLIGDRISANAGAQMLFGTEGEFRPPDYVTQVGDTDTAGLAPTMTALAWVRYAL